jgi:hypothetical protein
MSNSYGIQNYLNTLIFCVVAKIVTVILLSLLIIEKVRYFSFMLLTIEIGLIAIIVSALFVISRYNKKYQKMQNEFRKSKVSVLACPDYYVKTSQEGSTYCEDIYKTPDGKFIYKFSEDLPNYFARIPIESDFIKKTVEEVCQLTNESNYANMSWSSLKSKCNY